MALKLFLNVLYTIGIFVCAVIVWWAFPIHQYMYVLAAVFVAGLFIILKIKLLKELRTPPNKL
jgi:acyl-CoA reductase-like NAD-dependent aldehyde dehydrogenase